MQRDLSEPSAAALALEPRLTIARAGPLAAALLALRGRPLRLDASAVAAIATPCVQALLAAARSWRADRLPLVLVAPTPDFLAAIGSLGLALEALEAPGAAGEGEG